MSNIGDIQLDEEGFVDMTQFPDGADDFDAAAQEALRDVLLSDPVAEPDDAAWDAFLSDAFDHEQGPFAVEGSVDGADDAAIDGAVFDVTGYDDASGLEPVADETDGPLFDEGDDLDPTDGEFADGIVDESVEFGSDGLNSDGLDWEAGADSDLELDTDSWGGSEAPSEVVEAPNGLDFEDLL